MGDLVQQGIPHRRLGIVFRVIMANLDQFLPIFANTQASA
jgi:hypothetical protein